MKQQIKNVLCPNCQKYSSLKDSLQRRPLKGNKTVTDVGIACPHCEHFTHSYFDTPKIRRRRKRLKKARKIFARKQASGINDEKYPRMKAEFEGIFAAEQEKTGGGLSQ